MTLPADPSRLPVPASSVALPVPRTTRIASRVAPVLRASLVAAAAGLGVELALRAVATRALAGLGRAEVDAARSMAGTTRTIVTEFVVHERVRRFR